MYLYYLRTSAQPHTHTHTHTHIYIYIYIYIYNQNPGKITAIKNRETFSGYTIALLSSINKPFRYLKKKKLKRDTNRKEVTRTT